MSQDPSLVIAHLIARAIKVLDRNGYDLGKAAKPLARYLAGIQGFAYARHDKRKEKAPDVYRNVVTPEITVYAEALIAAAWTAWIHQAKSLWHFNETSVSGFSYLDNYLLPWLLRAVGIGRSQALLEKIQEGKYHPHFDLGNAVGLLREVTGAGVELPTTRKRKVKEPKPTYVT